ncbi:hypothetical protein HVA01_33140 [Halovibrio variabilis]|uniref:Polysaccharide chain length determinant N-terminal domain-containing protein n=1 Tax=Halovibrio variabilis TaxID=31910 RepID=A0A511UVA4_9GAMM|nr:hypothetical protein [Halovibrio variabilis]GEN29668.1 hypothetical protein HVA01_33140 [Halovibrio variabilis]
MSIEQPPRNTHHDDEITLVDLAKILIHRRWWLLGTFALVVLASAGWVLLQNAEEPSGAERLQYTTQLAVGYKTSIELIEPLVSIEEQLNGAIIPTAKQQNDEFNTLTANIAHNENSNIITLTTEGSVGQRSAVADFHEALIEPIVKRHDRLQRNLGQQRSPLFQGEREVIRVIPSERISLAVETLIQTLPNVKLILVLGILLGGIAGIMAAFFAEFVSRVRESIKKESQNQAKLSELA